jgi:hypothetical protein
MTLSFGTPDCMRAERSAIVAPLRARGLPLIIECTSCHARYQYDEERFEGKPSKKIKCAKCSSIFEIQNPGAAAALDADVTSTRRGDTRTPEPQETTAQSPLPERDTGPMQTPQLPRGRRLSLAIIAGADAGTVYRIEKPRLTIGRSADLTINDSEASRQHAAIEVRDQIVLLEDLKSTNGTIIDGVKLSAPVELQDKSEFQIGGTTMMLIVTEEA